MASDFRPNKLDILMYNFYFSDFKQIHEFDYDRSET